MDIHQLSGKACNKLGGQDAHEAGQNNQVRSCTVHNACQVLIKGFSSRVALVVNEGGLNARVMSN